MRSLAYILVLVAALVAVPVLSNVVVAQSVPFDRNLCQQNCAWLMGGARSYGGYANYYTCMANCNSRFWKGIERQTEETERSL